MNLATNVAVNSKPRKQDNDQCKHFSSINKRGGQNNATSQYSTSHPLWLSSKKTEEKQSARPEPCNSKKKKMKGRP